MGEEAAFATLADIVAKERAVNAAARAEAEWDGRDFLALGRADKKRYRDRFYAGLKAYCEAFATKPQEQER
jgi:hypothetical protein